MHAIAAAILGGKSSVEGSTVGLGSATGGGGADALGSTGSDMRVVSKIAKTLVKANSARRAVFRFCVFAKPNTVQVAIMTKKKFADAFTLIEMLVVIAIIATLVGLIFAATSGVLEKGKVTQDLNNLRQVGLATQMYLNDNDGTYFLPTENWMLKLHPKYLANWRTFQSPFDKRASSEADASAPVSYGFDMFAKDPTSGSALLSDRVTNPSVFILFAPSQPFTNNFGTTTGLVVSKNNAGSGGAQAGGTHNKGQRIDACMADLHVENMSWATFKDDGGGTTTDKSAPQRWNPTATPAP